MKNLIKLTIGLLCFVLVNTHSEEPPDVSGHKNLGLINGENCGPLTIDKIGGNKTEPFEFPWMALIYIYSGIGVVKRCGGTLINQHYILTAAHCITYSDGSTLIGVRLGEQDISKDVACSRVPDAADDCTPLKVYNIAEIIPHPQYDPVKHTNDIGMLRLGAPAESVRPICLPTGELRTESLVGKNVYIAGWGAGAVYPSDKLLKVLLPVITNDDCQRRYNSTRTQIIIGPQQLCVGDTTGKVSCSGDSTGPLNLVSSFNNDSRVVQYGILSTGAVVCGETNQPGVFTRTAFYMDWILDNMKH